MKHFIVSIRDRAADAFMPPWFVPTLGLAVRAFQDEVNKPDSPMHRHPVDYELFHLGEFEDQSGTFSNLKAPVSLSLGDQLRLKAV